MRKMVQFGRWFLQLILLCQLWELGFASTGGPKHSRLGVHPGTDSTEESIGNLTFFLIYIGLDKLGKKLDKGYICPVYCEVHHKHRYEKEKSNIQGNDGLPRPSEVGSGQQSESYIRSCPGTSRFCRDGEKIP